MINFRDLKIQIPVSVAKKSQYCHSFLARLSILCKKVIV